MMLENPDQALVELAKVVEGLFAGSPAALAVARLLLATLPLVLVFATCFAFTTWLERKGLARIQNRPGPNRVGPYGLFQPIADGIKMLTKEDIVPRASDRLVHFMAPVLMMIPAFVVLAFIPFGRNMTTAPIDAAVLFFFALTSVNTLAAFMAGWSSRNKYSLLGGMRAVAQMVSYELPLVLSAVVVVMFAGSLRTTDIVAAQQAADLGLGLGQIIGWNVFQPWGLAGFIIFFIAALAEANRSPFDLPEAESELISGHLTEYSGFKFALLFMGEYLGMFAMAALAVTLFLGGWSGPNLRPPWSAAEGALLIPGFVWFFLKLFLLVGLMIWVRGTFPRLRADQLMAFAWKFLLPLALVNIFVAGLYHHIPDILAEKTGWEASTFILTGCPLAFAALYFTAVLLDRLNRRPAATRRTYRFAT